MKLQSRALSAFLIVIIVSCCIQIGYAAEQYKLVSREMISKIVDGNYKTAIDNAQKYLELHSGDLESMYVLAVAYANQGNIDKAMSFTEQAIAGGMPFGRFLAGPRDLLEPLTKTREFKALRKIHDVQLLHGPMLGCLTDTGVKFWVRTASEVRVRLNVLKQGSPRRSSTRVTGRTDSNKDYTTVLAVDGLQPDTLYEYELQAGTNDRATGSFKTAPPACKPAKFQVGFGGGAGFTPQHERMWNTIIAHDPLAFLFLGDNVYIDHPKKPAVQNYCYYRRQSRPEYRAFVGSTPIYAIWDDHDFTDNDGWGGPEINKPTWKIPVWRLFMNNWVNPSYAGNSEKIPGCWFDFYIADVHFIMLDCRYYKTDPKVVNPSMLGPLQIDRLFKTLKSSSGTFKVLVSSVPWAYGAKPGSKDPWQGYKEEREKIFTFLYDNDIEGVVLLSADRHRSDLWKIERPAGYPLYEFESSRLTNIHTHEIMPESLFGYNEKCSFGLLNFDTTAQDPELKYQIYNIDDELVHTFSVRKSQLTNSGG